MKKLLIAAALIVSTANAVAFEDIITEGTKWTITEKSCNGIPQAVSGDEFITSNGINLVIVQRSKTEANTFCNTLQSYVWRKDSFSKIKLLYFETSLLSLNVTKTVCRDSETKAELSNTGVVAADEAAKSRQQAMSLSTTTGSNIINLKLVNSESCPALPGTGKGLSDDKSNEENIAEMTTGFRIKAVRQEKK